MSNLSEIVEYISDNYYEDRDKLSGVKIIGALAVSGDKHNIPDLVDKIALFNGIKKSTAPKEPLA